MHISRSHYRLLAALCAVAKLPVALAQVPANLISVTPCRVVDTRNATGSLGGPSMAGGSTRSFPIPASACGIPANASAYSLNITVVPSGPLGYVTIWPTGVSQPLVSTLNDTTGLILANAAIVSAGTAGAISVFVSNTTNIILDINGYFVTQSDSTSQSTALGTGASDVGTQNTAVGFDALLVNNTGNGNTATGSLALSNNTSGSNNAAIGSSALGFNAMGSANTAIGSYALLNNLIGNDNVAIGFSALWTNTTGIDNTAVGVNALFNSTTASGNIALGYEAGYQVTIGTNNIDIGNQGTSTDLNVIRIGMPGSQISTFVAGINNSTVSGSAVLVDSNTGQLGIATSSSLYKEDVHSMGDMSNALMLLRPVTFRYKQTAGDTAKSLQYGLIGEEVEKVFPELVVHGSNGQVESVQYHEFPALLLNELQKQHRTIEELEARIATLEELLTVRSKTGKLAAR